MKKVIVFGSLNMDLTIQSSHMPQRGETTEGYGFFTNPGGKGGNQAVAAAKLGADVRMIARVGKDLFGDELARSLAGYGVDCTYVERSEKESSGVAVILRCEGDNRIILSTGSNHEIGVDSVERALDEVAEESDVFITQLECDFETVLAALRTARKYGLYTIFNPAPAKKLPPEIYASVDLMVVNQTECEFLTDIYPEGPEGCARAISKMMDLGARSAIVTMGSGGSFTLEGGQPVLAKSYKVENVDTTAAGDSYIGALASRLVLGESLADSMQFATRAAALTVTRQGAQQSIPTLDEVEDYFKEEHTHE